MLLVIDAGNTNVKLGIFDGDTLVYSWRMSVKVMRTADEMGITMQNLFSTRGITFNDIDGIIMSSVSPSINYTIEHACQYYMNIKPMMVGVGVKTGLNIKYSNPHEVGADRIVNSVAGFKLYGGPCIIVDFGTATTFNMVSAKGEFLGGAIAPGIKTSLDSLVNNASKLMRIELIKPSNVIGKTTAQNMQSGTIYGFTGLVKYIVEKMKQESGYDNVKVIATGGLSELITEVDEDIIDIVDRYLTLKGLKIIYNMNVANNAGGNV